MFSQKKSFFRGKTFLLLIVGLLVAGYWINKGPEEKAESEKNPKVTLSADKRVEKNTTPVKQAAKPQPTGDSSEGWLTDSAIVDEENEDQGDVKETDKNENDQFDGAEGKPTSADEPDGIDSVKGSYYLIREDEGIIKIFYCEKGKKEQFIRATDITFSLLSESDQQLFQRGIVKQTEDDLSELLQDFES